MWLSKKYLRDYAQFMLLKLPNEIQLVEIVEGDRLRCYLYGEEYSYSTLLIESHYKSPEEDNIAEIIAEWNLVHSALDFDNEFFNSITSLRR